jgi:hypothetical protein
MLDGGASIGFSNAKTIDDTEGWFGHVGGSAEVLGGIGGDAFSGKSKHGRVWGFSGGPTIGGGLGGYGGASCTQVDHLFTLPNLIPHIEFPHFRPPF